MQDHAVFRQFCAALGRDMELVQGAGGNVSFKDGSTLHIKGSGTWLADALEREIFLAVPRADILAALEQGAEDFSALGRDGLRPSIETPIHALLPQKYVFHLHHLDAVVRMAWTDAPEGQSVAALMRGLPHGVVPYARPGLPLCRALQQTLAACTTPPPVLLLQNHGIVVAGDTLAAIVETLRDVQARLALPLSPLIVCDPLRLAQANDCGWRLPGDPGIHALATTPGAAALCRGLPLYPDHVVFLGPAIVLLREGQSLSTAVDAVAAATGSEAKFAVLPGAGVLVHPGLSKGEQAMLSAFAAVARRLPADALLATLRPADVEALCNWEAEKWRQHLDTSQENG